MTTNLVIGYPQITVDSTITTSTAFATTAPKENVLSGPRAMYGELATATTELWLKANLGSSQQKTIDFFYIARANILKAMGSTSVLLQGSTDDVSYSNIAGCLATFQSATLYGPRSEDIIFTSELANSTHGTLSASPTYRYWRSYFASGDPSKKYPFSKVMYGAWFDMGRDPEDRHVSEISGTWDRESRLVYRFAWRGISKTVKESFVTSLINKRENGCILYTKSYHDLLNEHRVLHCQIVDYSITVLTEGLFDISATFEEMI